MCVCVCVLLRLCRVLVQALCVSRAGASFVCVACWCKLCVCRVLVQALCVSRADASFVCVACWCKLCVCCVLVQRIIGPYSSICAHLRLCMVGVHTRMYIYKSACAHTDTFTTHTTAGRGDLLLPPRTPRAVLGIEHATHDKCLRCRRGPVDCGHGPGADVAPCWCELRESLSLFVLVFVCVLCVCVYIYMYTCTHTYKKTWLPVGVI